MIETLVITYLQY